MKSTLAIVLVLVFFTGVLLSIIVSRNAQELRQRAAGSSNLPDTTANIHILQVTMFW